MTNRSEAWRGTLQPYLSVYDNQGGSGGQSFIEGGEIDPKEPLSDKDLGELIRGIPNTRVALAVVFLAKHPDGLETHSDGMTAWEFYAGFSQMLGLSEDEASVTLGTRRNFAKFLRIAAKQNIIVASESESSQFSRYSLNPKFRSVSPEFAEVVLSHSFVHSMPFDIFFAKEKTKKLTNTDLPLRWQIIRYINRTGRKIGDLLEPEEIAAALGTGTDPVIYNIKELDGLGIIYSNSKRDQRRTLFSIENVSDELAPKPPHLHKDVEQTRQDVFKVLQDLRKENITSKYTLEDIYYRLLQINRKRYFREDLELKTFLYYTLEGWLEKLGTEKQEIEPQIQLSKERYIIDIVRNIEDFQMRRVDSLNRIYSRVSDITTNQRKARSLWKEGINFGERKEREIIERELDRLSKPLELFSNPEALYSDVVRELEVKNQENDLLVFWHTYREIEQLLHEIQEEDIMYFRLKNIFEKYNEALFSSIDDLIGKFINRSKHMGVPDNELRQVISIGVVTALKTYDPRKGTIFSTYAYWKIRGELSHMGIDRLKEVGIGSKQAKGYYQYIKLSNELFQILGRMPTPEEVVKNYPDHFTLADARDFYQGHLLKWSVSMDAPTTDDSDSSLQDTVQDEGVSSEINSIGDMDSYLKLLNSRERQIIEIFYGLTGHPPIANLSVIGKLPEVKLTRERVRQLYQSALEKILQRMREDPEDFLT